MSGRTLAAQHRHLATQARIDAERRPIMQMERATNLRPHERAQFRRSGLGHRLDSQIANGLRLKSIDDE